VDGLGAKAGRKWNGSHAWTRGLVGVLRDQRLDDPIQGHPDERYDLRPMLFYLSVENVPSIDIFHRLEIVDPGARPCDEIRHAKAPLEKPMVVGITDRFRHQSRIPQQLPEPI
jgi:hypothetical protein